MNKDKKPYKYERYSYCFLQPTPKYNPIYATITGVANTISQTISNVTVRPMSEPSGQLFYFMPTYTTTTAHTTPTYSSGYSYSTTLTNYAYTNATTNIYYKSMI